MTVSSIGTTTIGSASTSPPATAGGAPSTFASALDDQQRRAAARDVLTSMPPGVVTAVRSSTPGKPPVDGIDALFTAIKGGEFKPSDEQLAATGCIIATTARATKAFGSAEEMWSTMRSVVGSG